MILIVYNIHEGFDRWQRQRCQWKMRIERENSIFTSTWENLLRERVWIRKSWESWCLPLLWDSIHFFFSYPTQPYIHQHRYIFVTFCFYSYYLFFISTFYIHFMAFILFITIFPIFTYAYNYYYTHMYIYLCLVI